jgi:hypothetical protein
MSESGSDDTTRRAEPPELDRQDPLVERLRPHPAAPAPKVLELVGLLGNSDRPGHKRLYFSTALDFYAEVPIDNILHRAAIDAAQAPFVGHEASRLTVKRSAIIHYVRSVFADAIDDFDIDIQVSPGSGSGIHTLTANSVANCGTGGGCPGTFGCPPQGQTAGTCLTCQTCNTQCGNTCQTCHTQCGQATCQTCNQQTCQTCNTQCNQQTCWNTCQTCHTNCGGIDCALNNPTSPAHCIPTPGPTKAPCLTNNCG